MQRSASRLQLQLPATWLGVVSWQRRSFLDFKLCRIYLCEGPLQNVSWKSASSRFSFNATCKDATAEVAKEYECHIELKELFALASHEHVWPTFDGEWPTKLIGSTMLHSRRACSGAHVTVDSFVFCDTRRSLRIRHGVRIGWVDSPN